MIPATDHRGRLQQRLTELRTVERPRLVAILATFDGKDPADQADRVAVELDLAHVDARIQRLDELLADGGTARTSVADQGSLPRDATLVLDFGGGPESYRFGALDIDDGREVVTPDSPLGQALLGAVTGQRVAYATPRGQAFVTVVSMGGPAAA